MAEELERKQWLKVDNTSNPLHGDFQCNSAMSIHKHLKGRPDAPKAPRDVSVKIIAQLPDNELIVKTEIAGPGFINAFLSPEWV